MSPTLRRPAYDQAALRTGIVHVGPGAFHRAHQAAFVDDLLHLDPSWGIAAVSLRSGTVTTALARQHGRYVLRTLEEAPTDRLIAAHRAALGPGETAAAIDLFAGPDVRLVTATVTEKGYCRAADGGLDWSHPDIAHDAADASVPRSLPGFLLAGLHRRREAGLPGPALMSCDNVASNSAAMCRVVLDLAGEIAPGLVGWIENECRFVDTMVDAITPATTPDLADAILADHGIADAVAVQREPYAAWVVAAADDPAVAALARAGVTVTRDVPRWEAAKLRLLNGTHSLLAYVGLLAGHDTVAAAIGDPVLLQAVRVLMAEVSATLSPPDDLDLDDYAAALIARFGNRRVTHRLRQIAADGSQKLPQRLVAPLVERLGSGQRSPALLLAVASWMAWLIAEARAGRMPDDPLASRLTTAARGSSVVDAVAGLLTIEAVFAPGTAHALAPDLTVAVAGLLEIGPRAVTHIIEGRVG